jgi:trimeric autotransporter adhesin
MRRFSTTIVLALATLLSVSICSAQTTQNQIAKFGAGGSCCVNSIMSDAGTGRVDVNGNFNLTGTTGAYQIGGSKVLNIPGSGNLFVGVGADQLGAGGSNNTLTGTLAGEILDGDNNTFTGALAGRGNIGSNNTALGYGSGGSVSKSVVKGGTNNNIDIGYLAGFGRHDGDDNINIGYQVCPDDNPDCHEEGTIHIGNDTDPTYPLQSAAFIAGIYGQGFGGIPVYIDSSGQLSTLTSSLRFKEQVRDMGDGSSKLFQLRPVTFFYKPQYDNGSHLLQYGLIAEEVAKVYPEMVAYDKDGQPYSVKYQLLAPMLLNELQKQHAVVAAQQDVIKTQQEQVQTQGQQIADLQQRLSSLEWLIEKK